MSFFNLGFICVNSHANDLKLYDCINFAIFIFFLYRRRKMIAADAKGNGEALGVAQKVALRVVLPAVDPKVPEEEVGVEATS